MENTVYLGVWTNWSRGKVLGWTLTLRKDHGNLLIAFVSFFIALVSSRFWKIVCLLLHRWYSTNKPQDAIHHQRQVILRNSSSPEAGLASFVQLFSAWRHTTIERLFRILPPSIFALGSLAAFAVAGGFSSSISTSAGDEVLLNGMNCGIFAEDGTQAAFAAENSLTATKVNNAANYAQQCYNTTHSSALYCNKFVINHLPEATVDKAAECPFDSRICQTERSNIRLDTGYINSHEHLGLNAPADQRIEWRYVLQCAPLQTENYTTKIVYQNVTWVRYHYGKRNYGTRDNMTLENYVYEDQDVEFQYIQAPRTETAGLNYRLTPVVLHIPYGESISELAQSDGDLIINFLSGYGVNFKELMNDDWYLATVPSNKLANTDTNSALTSFRPARGSSPLACVEQWQWCNSAYPRKRGCGPLAGQIEAAYGAAPLFNLTRSDLDPDRPSSAQATGSRFIWPLLITLYNPINVGDLVHTLGAKSLMSQTQLNNGIQWPLPRDQWQLDVIHWFNMVLASAQASFVDAVQSGGESQLGSFRSPPLNAEEQKLCDNQKIRSSTHSSFSLFGLFFILATGGLIIIISFTLGPLLTCAHRRWGYKQYTQLEWVTNQSLQLHRLAHDNEEFSRWTRCVESVPVASLDKNLAGLDITDLEHPVLTLQVDPELPPKPEASVQTTGGGCVGSSLDEIHTPGGNRSSHTQAAAIPVEITDDELSAEVSPIYTTPINSNHERSSSDVEAR